MLIETIVDTGTAKYVEDAHCIALPFVAVADGVSAPYDAAHPMRFFRGMTGGQLAARTLCETAAAALQTDSIEHIIESAMERIGSEQEVAGIPLDRGDLLGGAGFAIASLGSTVAIAAVADVFAIWRLRNGTVGATRNQVAAHDAYLQTLIPAIRAEVGEDFDALFERLNPIRRRERLRDINGDGPHAFGLLCGQAAMMRHVERHAFDRSAMRDLVLCSDGAVVSDAADPIEMARVIFHHLDTRGSITALLGQRRTLEQAHAPTAHVAQCEVTILRVRF